MKNKYRNVWSLIIPGGNQGKWMRTLQNFLDISVAEIKWTDRFADNPTELKSLYTFLSFNHSVRKIFVTSKTRFGKYDTPEGKILFIPVAIYSYWISNFLYHSKKSNILQ